jgi:lysophospholipase L1-like esterase
MFPLKTALAIATLAGLLLLPQVAPAFKDYPTVDVSSLRAVLDLPIEKYKPPPEIEIPRLKPSKIPQPANLFDQQHALDHFYQALLDGGTVRILHYGDSPTTGDLITADARAAFQKQFGDAGGGYVLIARPWAWYTHRGLEMDSTGWKIDVAGQGELKDGMHGLGGASFRGSVGAVAHFRWRDASNRTLEIAYLQQPDGGSLAVDADGTELGSADTAGDEKSPAYASFEILAGAKRVNIRVSRGSVRLYGVEFRKPGRGVIYSALGINGANVTVMSHAFNERFWAATLKHYKPDLVIVNYGTNESGFASFVDKTWAPELTESVRRIHAALPGVSVLLMSPMDRGERVSGGIETVATLPRLVQIERGVAAESGAAFFNTFEAMGGKGTMARWYTGEPRLVGGDFIHPLPAGAKIVGELLYNALRDGLTAYKLRQLSNRMAEADKKKAVEGGLKK